MEKKLLLLINPKAGQKRANRYLTDVVEIFNRAGYTVITHVTAASGDAKQVILNLAQQVDLVVCCGGDGTFNETLSGVLSSGKKLPIGYIPAGSTNDLANSLGLSSNVLTAAKNIAQGTPMELDVGEFNGRHFSYVASFGLFTKTSYDTPQELKNALGHLAYLLNGIQEISQIKSHRMHITLSDGTVIEDNFIFGAVSNSTSFGGVLTLAKDRVDLCDGKLEIILIRAPKDFLELADCVRAMQQQTYDNPMITFVSTDALSITAPDCPDWTLDGEKEPGKVDIQIRCLHKAIQIYRKG